MRILPGFRMRVCTLVCLGMYGVAAHAASTSTALAASSSSASAGTAITLTATVTSSSVAVTPGTVNFCDASYTRCMGSGFLGSAQLNSSGVAKWKFIPAIGSHSYTAVFSAKTGYTTSTSSAASVSITGTRASTTVLTSSGSAGNYTLTATTSTVSNNNTAPSSTVTFQDTSNSNYSLGTATLGSGSTTPGFGTASSLSTSYNNSRQLATADFNGDGIPDLAVPTQSGTVSIYLASASGTFSAASGSPIGVGGTNVDVAAADVNGDGKIDLLVCDWYNGRVGVLLGNGDGTFGTPTYTATGSDSSAVAVGDFNNDGNLDLAVTSQNNNVVRIFTGNGSGSFTSTGTSYTTGSGPYSIAVADYNSDGNLDLAIGNNSASSVTVLLGSGNGGFTAATGSPLSAGTGVWSIITADLNNDGKPDLITGDSSDNNIGVFLGNGNGTFGSMTSYTVASGVKTVAVADFDRDGYLDVAVCNQSSSSVTILPGSSNGTLGTARTSALGSNCTGIVTGDWNGDGLPDIAADYSYYTQTLLNMQTQTATATLSSVSVPGNGSHNVQAVYGGDSLSATSTSNSLSLTASKVATTTSIFPSPTSSTYGQQVVLSSYVSPYAVGGLTPTGTFTFTNNGTALGSNAVSGAYGQRNVTSLPVGTNSLTATYNGDSNFNSSTSSPVTVTVSKSTPTISWSTPSAISYGTALSSTQLNASSGGVSGTFAYTPASGTVLNVGANQALSVTFTPSDPTSYNSATGSTTITVNQATPAVTLSASSSSLTSGNAESITVTVTSVGSAVPSGTVVLCNSAGTYCTGPNLIGQAQLTSSGTAVFKFVPSIGSHSYKAIFNSQMNYTIAASTALSITVTGSYKTATTIAASGSAGSYSLTSMVTATGSITTGPTGNVAFKDTTNSNYTVGTGALGSSTLSTGLTINGYASITPAARPGTTADLNGDGIPDLIIPKHGNPTGSISILLGNGDGTFTAGSTISLGVADGGVITADLNADGKLDIIAWSQAGNQVQTMLGNGDGTFQTATVISVSNNPATVVAGDFNRDGKLDLAFTRLASNDVQILFGDGTGAFPTNSTVSVGTYPITLVAGDYNADGYIDLAVANNNANSVTILLNDGTGNFSQPTGSPISVGQAPSYIYVTDLNHDGSPDLVTSNTSDSTLTILLGNGSGGFTASSLTVGSGTKFLTLADFNGDGKPDIAVCYNSAAQIGMNYGNNDGTFQTQTFVTLPGSDCVSAVQADFNGDGLPDIEASLRSSSTEQFLLNTTGQTASASVSSVSIPGNGSHNITANYAGDSGNVTSTSAAISLTASPVTTSLTLSAAPTSATYGQSVTLTATLSPNSVGGLSTGGETITFQSGGNSIGTGTLSSGVATLTLTSLTAGTDNLNAVYAGDSNFLGSTSNTVNYAVAKATPTISWTTPSAITYGTALSSTQLNATSGGVSGTFTYTPASGAVLNAGAGQTLAVTFTPSDPTSYNTANGSTTITVNKATPAISAATSAASSGYGSAVTFTATLPSGTSGTVTFLDSGNAIGTGTLSGTTATFSISTLAVGSHTITASWPGNSNYLSNTSASLSETIVKSAVSLNQGSSLNPAIYGDAVTLSIVATGSGVTPTGTVTLKDGGTTLATLTLSGSGTASYVTSAFVAGSHSLTATYGGDTNYY